MTDAELVEEIEAQRSVMIAISTGGYNQIEQQSPDYKRRRERIQQALVERHLSDPNPHYDLRRWYGKWSSGDLPTYHSRRTYINEMFDPIIENIKRRQYQVGSDLFTEATGWTRVDRTVDKIRESLERASAEEEFQTVGLLCRECLISLAQAIYEPAIHGSGAPSETDAKRMLEGYFSHQLPGASNEELRHSARATVSLASALVHRRTATFIDAAICSETTLSIVNLVAILTGRRNSDS